MVSSICWEWELVLIAIKIGMKLSFIYDGIHIFRLLFSHRKFIISVEDFFFWVYATMIMFQFQLEQSNGILRGFSILGTVLGMMLYHVLLGKRLVGMAEKGISIIKRQLTEGIKVLKMKLSKECDGYEKNRSKHGRKKNPDQKKEAKQFGNAVSNDGCFSNDGSSCH